MGENAIRTNGGHLSFRALSVTSCVLQALRNTFKPRMLLEIPTVTHFPLDDLMTGLGRLSYS